MQKEVKSVMPGILAAILTLGFFGALAALMQIEVPEKNEALVYTMLGSLGAAWLSAMQFYYGTTKSSQDKTGMLKK